MCWTSLNHEECPASVWSNTRGMKPFEMIRRYHRRGTLSSVMPLATLAFCLSTYGVAAFEITSPSTVTAAAGGPFTYQIETSSPASNYTAGSLPAWLSFDHATGLLSGIAPTTPGDFIITISASDDTVTASLSLTLNVARLTPLDPLDHKQFGGVVALSGNTAVVRSQTPDTDEVLVSVYVNHGSGWVHEAVLSCQQQPYLARPSIHHRIAISGNTVVVPCEIYEQGTSSEAVAVFERSQTPNGPAWTQTALLGDFGPTFGASVAITDSTIVIGQPYLGVAHVFVRAPSSGSTSWGHAETLTPANADPGDFFGFAVAISGDTIVVGAGSGDGPGNTSYDSGAAYIFVGGGSSWTQEAHLRASNAEAGDGFGYSVSISGDTVVVGAIGEDSNATGLNGNQADNSAEDVGAAYVFERSGTAWSQKAYLKRENPADTYEKQFFGWFVAVDGKTAVVQDHMFWRKGTLWTYKSRLSGIDGGAGPQVAVSGETIIQGGYQEALLFGVSPRGPVVFIHGIAGSVLKSGSDTIWPSINPADVADLNLATGPADIEAVDVVREVDATGTGLKVQQVYKPFLAEMVQNHGYQEFQMQEDRRRMTNSHISTLAGANKPDLFTYPYDWRKPNADHTATLHAYLQNISNLHDGAKVNLVVHSMGGLVMRRYLLDYGSDLIGRVVTVGSPLWGAPESAYRMFSGIFFDLGSVDLINSSTMKTSVLSMPAVHELNPSTKFYQTWGLPVFVEQGLDYDGNGTKNEGYPYAKFRATLDDLAHPQTPGPNNIAFHEAYGGRQDDWSADTNNVEFLHIVGKQAVNKTTIEIRTRPKTLLESILPNTGSLTPPIISGYGVFERIVGEGDGTVPILSAKRSAAYYAPNTQVREITEPLAGKLSDKQPAGQAAEHTKLMENTTVWTMINNFLETGTATASPRRATAARVGSKTHSPIVTSSSSANTALESLVLSSGTLSPDFSGDTTSYTSSVPYAVDSLTVTPTTSDPTASVQVNDTAAASGSPSNEINLEVGPNTIDVTVTAPDGTTSRTHTVIVTRAEPTGRKQMLVTGCGYVAIRDEQTGEENTLLSEIAAERIPGVEVVYNADAGWVLMDFASDRHISVGSVPDKPAAEVEITSFDAAGGVLDVRRFRSVAGGAPWKATVAPNQPASLNIDSNNDGTFAPGEQVAPDFSANGPSIDMNPPDVQLVLSLVGNQIQLAATGADASAYNIRYQIDSGPLTTYAGPVLFSRDSQSQIALFAEDALGNTSGVINTRLNPRLSLQAGPGGSSFTMEWLEAEGYRLQSAENLQGPWTNVTAPQLLSNGRMSTTVTPPAGTRKAFYRLIAHPVLK
jgi:pimeloyl-ACP methyl ester carboxylesterase